MESIGRLVTQTREPGHRYHEFLRRPSLSAGVFVLPVGGVDTQSPHSEDEVYYVVRGRGKFSQGSDVQPVGPGDILFVPAHEVHRFRDVEEELVLLVVFAPAESSGP
jgi:mannose-6-phosphate isomerase-like protein (cupin superfamily)